MNIPTVKPEWRTATVIELCQSMRESQDFSALPILADALQDADCDDEELLTRLREGSVGWVADVKLVAIIMSADAEGAIRRIEDIAASLGAPYRNGDNEDGSDDWVGDPLTCDMLLDVAKSNNDSEWGDFISMGHNEAYKGDGFPRKEF